MLELFKSQSVDIYNFSINREMAAVPGRRVELSLILMTTSAGKYQGRVHLIFLLVQFSDPPLPLFLYSILDPSP